MREIARIAAGVVALLLVLRNAAIAGDSPAMLSATVLLGLLVAAALTLWRDGFVTASGAGLALHYVAALVYGDVSIDLAAPVVGALVVLYLDLADLATSVPRDRRVDRALLRSSARHALRVLAIGTFAGAGVLLVAAAPWPGGEWLRALGALGVGAVVAAPLYLLRRAQ